MEQLTNHADIEVRAKIQLAQRFTDRAAVSWAAGDPRGYAANLRLAAEFATDAVVQAILAVS